MKVWGYIAKAWDFIWNDDSFLSWVLSIILAFIIIKYGVYPALGFVLGTDFPIVAVVSESMEHNGNFEQWWDQSGDWYLQNNITKQEFSSYSFRRGFNKGDIIVLVGAPPEKTQIGDVLVFISHPTRPKSDPIIHRVVGKNQANILKTKGDNNQNMINECYDDGYCVDETRIESSRLLGKAVFRIPLLGYIKIWAVQLIPILAEVL
ncbi:MAG: hypothetical protein MAG795_00613 [Candidatus Woesearchaeota archaeon]|nr:hypothetical protein [Candidatus Woesearchaeota archaeon]